jgi:type 1 fimbria pilin
VIVPSPVEKEMSMIAWSTRVVPTLGFVSFLLLLFTAQAGAGTTMVEPKKAAVILSAAANLDSGNLDIHGTGLVVANTCPEIALGGVELENCLFRVDEGTRTQWVSVSLPSDIGDGTHLLTLTTVNGTTRFEVALGAIGPAGEDGAPSSKADLYSLGCVSIGQPGVTTSAVECSCGDTEDIALGGRCTGPEGASLSGAGTDGNSALIQPSVKASYSCTWTKAPELIGTFVAVVDCIDVDADTIP